MTIAGHNVRMTLRTPLLALVLALVPTLVLTACTADSDGRATTARDGAQAIEVPPPGGKFMIPSRVASIPPIVVEVLGKGTGLHARDGDTVAVRYIARLADGTVFDSSEGKMPYEFPLGQGAVIRGWDMVVKHMTVGDRWKVEIPSRLAYDQVGSPPTIPPDADLTFEMELVRVR